MLVWIGSAIFFFFWLSLTWYESASGASGHNLDGAGKPSSEYFIGVSWCDFWTSCCLKCFVSLLFEMLDVLLIGAIMTEPCNRVSN